MPRRLKTRESILPTKLTAEQEEACRYDSDELGLTIPDIMRNRGWPRRAVTAAISNARIRRSQKADLNDRTERKNGYLRADH